MSDEKLTMEPKLLPKLAIVSRVRWWKSQTLWGLFTSLVMKALLVLLKWTPSNWGISDKEFQELLSLLFLFIGAVGDYFALRGRMRAVSGGVARKLSFSSKTSDQTPSPSI